MKFGNSLSVTISKSAKNKKRLKYLDFFISSKYCYLLFTCVCVFMELLANAVCFTTRFFVSIQLAVVAYFFSQNYKYNLE